MYKVTVFKNIRETSTPFIKPVEYMFQRIKEQHSKDIVNRVRAAKTKKEADLIKGELPSICFSGEFKNRSKKGILNHSGLICLDFDKYENHELLLADRMKLEKDPYTYALFTSPSGKGLKVITKIPAEIENHKLYFDALEKYHNNNNFDSNVSDVSRVCYESIDDNIFINEKAKIWNKKDENEIHSLDSGKNTTIKLTNESEIIKRVVKWFEKNYNFSEGSRNSNMFVLAAALSDFGVDKLEALRHCLQHEQGGKDPFTRNEIENVVNSAYKKGVSQFGMKFFEDKEKISHAKTLIKSGNTIDEIKKKMPDVDIDALNNINDNISINNFWTISKNGVDINHLEYKYWLQANGFYKYYPDGSESYIYVRVENNLIDNTNEVRIKEFVLSEMLNNGEHKVYQYLAGASKYFKDEYLNMLEPINLCFKEDTLTEAYIYFRNGAVKVEKENVTLIDYLDLNGFVWKKHIIDFDIVSTEDIECDFKKFIYLVSNKDERRETSLATTLGYLMHSFKTSANNKAVILNDETISENPNGGSGKGIFWNALSKVKRVADINGKSFSFEKSFPYQTVSADTQILVFDDVQKNFKFENLFSIITEGITLEKKNKDAIKIPVSKSPKILITTNYTIGGVGGSFERRKWELEFSAHFSHKHTPLNEFGKMLFDEWSKNEWLKFYNYMIRCIQLYLINGLTEYDFKNLEVRKFIKETSFEFHEWVNDNPVKVGERIDKTTFYSQFLEEYPDWAKYKLSQKRFWIWVEKYADFKQLKLVRGQDSMGSRYVELIPITNLDN